MKNIAIPIVLSVTLLALIAAAFVIAGVGVAGAQTIGQISTTTNAVIPTLPVNPNTSIPVAPTTSAASSVPLVQAAVVASPGTTPMPEIVSVDNSGNMLLRGSVSTVGTNTLTLSSWGGVWTIRIGAPTQVEPGTATPGDTSGIPAGDFVGVEGTVAQDQPWTIDATVVHDWTASPPTAPVSTDTSGSVSTTGSASSSTSGVPAGDTLYTGTASDVSNVANGSFTLTDASGTTYTVSVVPDATVWDNASADISLSSLAQGDSIRLDGSLQTGGSLSADVVRDTSQ